MSDEADPTRQLSAAMVWHAELMAQTERIFGPCVVTRVERPRTSKPAPRGEEAEKAVKKPPPKPEMGMPKGKPKGKPKKGKPK
jgi:hypothetical protein